jgi:hypothetical protein
VKLAVQCATPLESVTAPQPEIVLPPAVKLMLPVGVVPLFAVSVTVAVKVVLPPAPPV